MKNMKRAIRRHHYARLKNKRYKDLKQWSWWGSEDEQIKEYACRMVTTAHPCSCLGCGNPRKHLNELTLQEQRNLLSFKEEMGSWLEWT